MERARLTAFHTPFPNGESYAQVAVRMRSFLTQLAAERDGQHVMLVGHGATLWMLAHWLQEHPLEAVVGVFPERPWRFALDAQRWQKATPPAAP
jgi:broad specificity phosphatase PhoE